MSNAKTSTPPSYFFLNHRLPLAFCDDRTMRTTRELC